MIPKFRAWDEKNKEMFKDTFAVTESGEVVTVEQDFITNAPDYIFNERGIFPIMISLYLGCQGFESLGSHCLSNTKNKK